MYAQANLEQFYEDYPEYRDARKLWRQYVITYRTGGTKPQLAAGATVQADLTIGSDGDFITLALNGIATADGDAGYLTTPFLINLFYTSQNRAITSAPAEWTTVLGNLGSYNPPLYLAYPIIILRNDTFSTTMTNPGAVAANITITLAGFVARV